MMKRIVRALSSMIEYVTDVQFNDDGSVSAKGMDDSDLAPAIGYHFGFYSRPLDGAVGTVIKGDGKGGFSFLFAWRDRQYELSLQKGEVGIQNAFGAFVLLDKNALVNLNGSAQSAVRGEDIKAWLEAHTHGTPVGPSSTPVQPFTPTILSSKVKLT